MGTKLARLVDVLLVWAHLVFLLFLALCAILAAHGGHMGEEELPKGFGPAAAGIWVVTILGWAVAILIIARRLFRRLGFSSDKILLRLLVVGIPVVGYLYYRRNLRGRLFGPPEVPPVHHGSGPQPRWLRCALDVWLTLQPGWMTLFYWYTFPQGGSHPLPPIREVAFAPVPGLIVAGLLGWWVVVFWCASMVDDIDRGWRKVMWYAVMLLLGPFGPTLCYFTHLRARVFGGPGHPGVLRTDAQAVNPVNHSAPPAP
jgi:hypothetical protein